MKIKIGSYEAKTKLPELLRQVKTGKSFTMTNRGEAIADLVPGEHAKAKDKVAAAKKLKAFMLADPVRGVNIWELIDYAKANQGKMNYATSGVGGANHLAGVEFANRTGVQWVYVPYKGGAQAIADVAGGQSNVMKNG